MPFTLRRRLLAALGAGTAYVLTQPRSARAASAATSAAATPAAASGVGSREQVVADLVTANHILFREGLVDAFGHVTARDPANPGHYLMAANARPPFVTAADIVALDADSNPVSPDAPTTPFERFIHGEIYRLRPDVHAIVHSHAAALLPFGLVKSAPLRPVCHTAGFLGDGAPVFDLRDTAGDGNNLMIQNIAHGAALARALGSSGLVLMRGHGFSTVAGSIQGAVYNAIYAVQNARVQMDALRLGSVAFLSAAEAAATARVHGASTSLSWEIWAQRAAGRLP
jgi:HCOMODA/2-hydroxy-3-carboxy-muconic semialdehyde decarboxylase